MKRRVVLIGAVLLFAALLVGTTVIMTRQGVGDSETPGADEISFEAVVLEVLESSLYLYGTEEGAHGGLLYVALPETGAPAVEEGDLVQVWPGPIVQETFPPQYPMTERIENTGRASDALLEKAGQARDAWMLSIPAPPEGAPELQIFRMGEPGEDGDSPEGQEAG